MKVFVTGGTGVVGRRAVPMLIAAGHEVTAAGRSRERLAALERAGARTLALDLFDRAAVERAVAGQEVVVNLATHIPPSSTRMMLPGAWRENDHIRREGSALSIEEVRKRLALDIALNARGVDLWLERREADTARASA